MFKCKSNPIEVSVVKFTGDNIGELNAMLYYECEILLYQDGKPVLLRNAALAENTLIGLNDYVVKNDYRKLEVLKEGKFNKLYKKIH